MRAGRVPVAPTRGGAASDEATAKRKILLASACLMLLALVMVVLLLLQIPPLVVAPLVIPVLFLTGHIVRVADRRRGPTAAHQELGSRRFLPVNARETVALAFAVVALSLPQIGVTWVREGPAEVLHPVRVALWLVAGYALWFTTIRRARGRRSPG
ncbi:hypothetical protein KCV87_02280 [Actinosynnema pretiosum subsp. pretiosum]|uniref:Uncharacterized protein n=2 Tax=Actinosynnema TaxID=40566 RepID=C6WAX9_ACTMD|nr:hypothetical protein [Actinosynnema mirum]ACU37448.1 hypothetical protein Amir_3557 [Actinosynnema mirum DSM 43827]AXX30921.1 hypothetical protein APASM_3556 [Actinosynnema pretiosum subsp. pretiosum]QUF04978.1 hypothetical protein KCV87_02280 [Actinosynnema pretiosum subsp. pretiosum]